MSGGLSRIQRDVIVRGTFTLVKDLDRKLMRYIRRHNKNPKLIKRKYATLLAGFVRCQFNDAMG